MKNIFVLPSFYCGDGCRAFGSIALTSVAIVALLLLNTPNGIAADCQDSPGVGCVLPEQEEAKLPSGVSDIAGKDNISVSHFGGNLVVQATDVSLPSTGAFKMHVTRTYHSSRLLLGQTGLQGDYARRLGPLGLGWTFHYGVLWPALVNQSLNYEFVHGDGTREMFYVNDVASTEMTALKAVAPSGDSYVSKSLSVLYKDSQDPNTMYLHTASGLKLTLQPLARLLVTGPSCLGKIDIGGAEFPICNRLVPTKIEDLSGNSWKIEYATDDQEYVEHPIVDSVTDDGGRKLSFVYARGARTPGKIDRRHLDKVNLSGAGQSQPQLLVDYEISRPFPDFYTLDAVKTPEGRRTVFTYDVSGAGSPNAARFGLLTGITNPLGGGTSISYEQRQFRSGSFYPRPARVQAVKLLIMDPRGVQTAAGNDSVSEAYSYDEPGREFVTTVIYRVGQSTRAPQATRIVTHHSYAQAGCSDFDRVGLQTSTKLLSGADSRVFVEHTSEYDHPLVISRRRVNLYCDSQPTIFRVSGQEETDTQTGLELTTTPEDYDYFSPKTVTRNDGITTSRLFKNVISAGRLSLGLLASYEATIENGNSKVPLEKTTFSFHGGSSDHLVQTQNVYRTPVLSDAIQHTYYPNTAANKGKAGAVHTATRGGLQTTYDYSHGVLSEVKGPSSMVRRNVEPNGTYASETRDGVTTTYSWDKDGRITKREVQGTEAFHISYCSKSVADCSDNSICIGRGSSCDSALGTGHGRNTTTFDGLGRKISLEDAVDGAVKRMTTWGEFDYAGRPTQYSDPVRGLITQTYDLSGRLLQEVLGGSIITDITRNYTTGRKQEITKREGIEIYNEDDSAGRPILRGFKRNQEPRIDLTYDWSMNATTKHWRSEITSTAWSSFRVAQEFDLLGRLVRQERPEIGAVEQDHDARGYLRKTFFPNLGYRLCYTVNARGQVESTRKTPDASCTGGEIIQATLFDPSHTEPTSIKNLGTAFSPGLEVERRYTNFDDGARARTLTLRIPRGLDAPAPWIGAELFPQPPDPLLAFKKSPLAFTSIEEVAVDGFYEMEVRVVSAAGSLIPSYDWGEAQKECESGTNLARGTWAHGNNKFTGAELHDHVQKFKPGYVWDLQPGNLYCWRVRAVKCHDGRSTCKAKEISPSGTWGVFAFNNSEAMRITSDGWDNVPTNKRLNTEELYQTCGGRTCPNVVIRGDDLVSLTAERTFTLAGEPKTITYPSADTTVEGWFYQGSKLEMVRNNLGSAKKLTLRLADGVERNLVEYTSFTAFGAPKAGTVSLYGYAGNEPGRSDVFATPDGEVGLARTSLGSITLNWDYDARGRLFSQGASRANTRLYALNSLNYTEDSLPKTWARADEGLTATYGATYDDRGQLKTYAVNADSLGSGTVTYTIDNNGNVTGRTGDLSIRGVPSYRFEGGVELKGVDGAISLRAASFGTFDAENRNSSGELQYDGEGRVIRDQRFQFLYSHGDQIETVMDSDGVIERQMLYDGAGNLVRLVSGNTTHYYLHDEAGRLLYEEVHDHWFYGPKFRDDVGRVVPSSRRYEYIYMGRSHLATVEHTAGVSSLRYAVRDWRDFEVVSLDADDAFTRVYREVSPYGKDIRSSIGQGIAASNTALPASYLQGLDLGGYVQNQWRTLDWDGGRFTRPDPALAFHERFPQGANLYANNLNNPLRYVDRDGRIPVLAAAGIAFALVMIGNDHDQADLTGVLLLGVGEVIAPALGWLGRGLRTTSGLADEAAVVIANTTDDAVRTGLSSADDALRTAESFVDDAASGTGQLSKQAQKGIRSLEEQIAKHEQKLADFKANPTVRPGMDKLPKEVIQKQQQARIQHLEQEIQTFKDNIEKLRRGDL